MIYHELILLEGKTMKHLVYMLNMMIALALISSTPFTKFLISKTLASTSGSLSVRHIAIECLEIYRYNPSQTGRCRDIKNKINYHQESRQSPNRNKPFSVYKEL